MKQPRVSHASVRRAPRYAALDSAAGYSFDEVVKVGEASCSGTIGRFFRVGVKHQL